jgi:type IV pilus assembly protein PilW
MIAITIGFLMLAGILQVSAASKESSRLQRNMGFVQENIRTAMEMLGHDIRQAGYYEGNNQPPFSPIVAATTTDGGGALNDVITVAYQSAIDCLGQDTPDQFAVNRYYINNERLMCLGNGNAIPQPLVEGVESMQILYGENTDGDPRSANRYVKAEEADLDNVVSVRIALRFHSRENIRTNADNNKYALLDAGSFTPAATDRRLRREVTTTISLRNENIN